ncbi:MAG: hypothetical protein ACRCTN_03250 [Carnobacterium maltaromaticum]
MKKKFCSLVAVVMLLVLVGCTQSDKVSQNISKEADNFNIIRRVTVINSRTDKIEFEVIGKISVDTSSDTKLVIVAETEDKVYKKHLVNLTEWNMYVVEDLEGAAVNQYKYEVNYMPESIVPFTVTNSD